MYCYFQATMMELDHHQLLHRRSEPASFEDDLYYAELERQIMRLTADDDEEDDDIVAHHNASVFRGKPLIKPSIGPTTKHATSADVAAVRTDYLMSENYGNHRGFAGMAPWHKSSGTGVFIPQTIKSQTSHHSYTGGRMNYGRKKKRQMDYKNHIDQCASSGCNKRDRRDE